MTGFIEPELVLLINQSDEGGSVNCPLETKENMMHGILESTTKNCRNEYEILKRTLSFVVSQTGRRDHVTASQLLNLNVMSVDVFYTFTYSLHHTVVLLS